MSKTESPNATKAAAFQPEQERSEGCGDMRQAMGKLSKVDRNVLLVALSEYRRVRDMGSESYGNERYGCMCRDERAAKLKEVRSNCDRATALRSAIFRGQLSLEGNGA